MARQREAARPLPEFGSAEDFQLQQALNQLRGKPVIAPTADSKTVAAIRAKVAELGMNWPQVYEGGGWETRLAKQNDVKSIPATYLLDRKGVVRYRNLRGEELGKRVAELLAEKP